ncbi:MAG: hypothetical protein WC972_13680 [Trueperaceae bacterium]
MVPLRKSEEAVDADLGARLGRRFDGDARKLAHVARIVIITSDRLRARTLLYVPPPFAGGVGVTVIPTLAPSGVQAGMLAVACGLHLDGTLRPTSYANGVLVGPTMPRHRAAVAFAQGFMRAVSANSPSQRRARAG